jgi:MOSC domain-containing protein YiiM
VEGPGRHGHRQATRQHAVAVTAPGPKGTGAVGLAGDQAHDVKHHGGSDQALYAYAREDLDTWQEQLGRRVHDGSSFGENLTTVGLDVNGAPHRRALVHRHRRPARGHLPADPLRHVPGVARRARWLERFIEARQPGAYLRVVEEGSIRAGDRIEVVGRPPARRDGRPRVPGLHHRAGAAPPTRRR